MCHPHQVRLNSSESNGKPLSSSWWWPFDVPLELTEILFFWASIKPSISFMEVWARMAAGPSPCCNSHDCFLPRVCFAREFPRCPHPCNCFLTFCHWKPPWLLHWPKHEGSWVLFDLVWFSTRTFSDNTTDAEVTPALYFQSLAQPGAWHSTLYLCFLAACVNDVQFFLCCLYGCIFLSHVKCSKQTRFVDCTELIHKA